MGKWHDEIGSKYLSTSKGNVVELKIIAINKVTDKPDFEPANMDKTRQGFVFEFVGENGILGASTYALQTALKEADVDVGDTIRVEHPEDRKYIVTKI